MRKQLQFAVAVRNGNELFLSLRIRRSPEGEVFAVMPTGRDKPEWKKWNPHASYHKDGGFHHKSFDEKHASQKRQKPDANFQGEENILRKIITAAEPRAFGVICNPDDFADVFELPADLLKGKRTYIDVHLVEASHTPQFSHGINVLAQRSFDDAVPRIFVTLSSSS